MLKQFDLSERQSSASWRLDFPPAVITIHNLKTGAQVQEPSLAAVTRTAPEKLLAVGRAALEYKNNPEATVLSPFRQGQVAHFPTAEQLLKALLKQAGLSSIPLSKPVMCVHIQEGATQVEEHALGEAAIMAGARKVFFYTEPLSVMLNSARSSKNLKNAVIIHIDPQE